MSDAAKEYEGQVKWLREHVAPDDIYDFAQQAVIAAEHFITKLLEHVDIQEECLKDAQTARWFKNIMCIGLLRQEGFKGILDISWYIEDK